MSDDETKERFEALRTYKQGRADQARRAASCMGVAAYEVRVLIATEGEQFRCTKEHLRLAGLYAAVVEMGVAVADYAELLECEVPVPVTP